MEIFKLIGSIFIKSDEADATIDSTTKKVQEMSSKLGTTLTNVGTTMTNVGTKLLPVSTAIGGLGVVAVKSAAEVKAMNSQFEQTFGSLQDQASDAMGRVADESGILQTRLQGVGTSIYAFAKASGADSAEAMTLMEDALRATADASAYYDRSLEETSESLMSFLKGNYANDAQLGVSCTETTRNAKAMELFGQKFNDLTEIQKQQTLLKMVTDAQALSGAMGQASRESDGFENVMGNLKESVKMLGAEFGEVLLPTVIDFVQALTGLIQKFSEMGDGTKKLIVIIASLVAGLGPALIIIGKIVTIVGSAITAFGKIQTVISAVVTAVKGLGLSFGFLTSPITLVIAGITALVAGFIYLWNNCEGFRNFWIDLWENIKTIASEAITALVEFFTGLWEDFTNIWNGIVEVVSQAWDTICNVIQVAGMFIIELIGLWFDLITLPFRFIWENCKETIIEIWDAITLWLSEKFTEITTMFTTVWTAISDFMTSVWTTIQTVCTTIWTAIQTFLTNTMNAIGTVITNTMNAINSVCTTVWNAIKSVVVSVWDAIQSKVSSAMESVKNCITNGLNIAKNTVTSILDAIKNKFQSIWDNCVNVVSNAVSKLKSIMNFEWKLPHLKLPHVSISGSFSLNPPSAPRFSVEWYKNGGIMLDPTIFGMNGNKLMAGGEAGAEAVAPIDLLLGYIRTAVAEQNASLIQSLKDAIDDLGKKMSDKTEGDIIIPVYIGDTMIDDIIVKARKNITLRSGGLTSV